MTICSVWRAQGVERWLFFVCFAKRPGRWTLGLVLIHSQGPAWRTGQQRPGGWGVATYKVPDVFRLFAKGVWDRWKLSSVFFFSFFFSGFCGLIVAANEKKTHADPSSSRSWGHIMSYDLNCCTEFSNCTTILPIQVDELWQHMMALIGMWNSSQ